ncbi:MAG: autoinducer binding domain-containing protein [Pseudomonadota bacterium]
MDIDLYTRLTREDYQEDPFSMIQGVIEDLGFRAFSIALIRPIENKTIPCYSSFADDYIDLYMRREYFYHCPVIKHCAEKNTFMNWIRTYPVKNLPKKTQEIYQTSADFDINEGIAVPLHTRLGKGFMSLQFDGSGNELVKYTEDKILTITACCELIMTKVINQAPESILPRPKLSVRESECLKWLCSGLNNKEIAKIMRISINRVKELISLIFQKLHVVNRTEAAVRAVEFGIVNEFYTANSYSPSW